MSKNLFPFKQKALVMILGAPNPLPYPGFRNKPFEFFTGRTGWVMQALRPGFVYVKLDIPIKGFIGDVAVEADNWEFPIHLVEEILPI